MMHDPSCRWSSAAWQSQSGASRFVRTTRSTRSGLRLPMEPASSLLKWKPALFTRMSSPPNSATASSTTRRQASASVEVTGDGGALAPGLLHPGERLRCVGLLLREVIDGDVGALAGEGDRHSAADAGVTAGDQGAQAGQLPRPGVGLLAVVGARAHLGRQAGGLLLLWREARLVCPCLRRCGALFCHAESVTRPPPGPRPTGRAQPSRARPGGDPGWRSGAGRPLRSCCPPRTGR